LLPVIIGTEGGKPYAYHDDNYSYLSKS
jgi:hypothetical protein